MAYPGSATILDRDKGEDGQNNLLTQGCRQPSRSLSCDMKLCKDCGEKPVAIDESGEELDRCIDCWKKYVRRFLPRPKI